jgi:hypothetical protein
MASDKDGIIEEQDSVAYHDLMNLQQFRLVLENAGMVLSYEDLIQVFTEITGDDRKECITMLHLITFAEKTQKLHGKANPHAILRRCLKSSGFSADFLLSVGAVFYVSLDWVDDTNELSTIGAICYFLGAGGGTFNIYNSLSRSLCSVEPVNVRLRAAAVKLGMLATVKHEESKSLRKSWILGVKESQISWLSQVNLTVAMANWEGIGRKASASDNRKGLKQS